MSFVAIPLASYWRRPRTNTTAIDSVTSAIRIFFMGESLRLRYFYSLLYHIKTGDVKTAEENLQSGTYARHFLVENRYTLPLILSTCHSPSMQTAASPVMT